MRPVGAELGKERDAELRALLTQTYVKLATHEGEPRSKWLRDLLAFAADELYDDYYRPARRSWIGRSGGHPITCPACQQVERIERQEPLAAAGPRGLPRKYV